MEKITITIKVKHRDMVARDLLTNNLYRPKVFKCKKKYDRKKDKNSWKKYLD